MHPVGNLSAFACFNVACQICRIGSAKTVLQVTNNTEKLVADSYMVYFYTKNTGAMSRQSISLSKPNDEWLKIQVESNEYSSKSELVNDLIRQARKQHAQIDWIRSKLEISERSGFTMESKEEILKQSKSLLNG